MPCSCSRISSIRTLMSASRMSGGTVRRTVWSSRYGPMISEFQGMSLPWTASTAFSLADANAGNFRLLNSYLATDEASSVRSELSILGTYQGLPGQNTIAADSAGNALYSSVMPVPDVTDAEAQRCDTTIGQVTFQRAGLPVLDGSNPSCAWGTDPDSLVPGIFGAREEPSLIRRDFTENSNSSYWLANPASPLTGYPRIIGDTGAQFGTSVRESGYDLRTRSALSMIAQRIGGSDGLGAPGFTLAGLENLMYSDIQYGATLVKPALIAMCRSFPHGQAPTSSGNPIAVGDSCQVLAAWDDTENPGSRGAVLFRYFWQNALNLPSGPWLHPYQPARPLTTPYGLDTASVQVRQAFGDALQAMTAAQLPYDVALSAVQYVTLNGERFPLPGGPADPVGEFNAIYQSAPGAIPLLGSTYIQAVGWATGDSCPQAATVLAYSESSDSRSPHHTDQTRLFSQRRWATAYFCPAQVAAHALSTTVVASGG
jgi:acyl-homoserine-lactone acylase